MFKFSFVGTKVKLYSSQGSSTFSLLQFCTLQDSYFQHPQFNFSNKHKKINT